ncbi:MAG: dihydroorotase [Prevotellaceae bacterium]|jgi:dihydroorotase|nr:dihydroorotase [Prevotellaceae bacterium]
MKKIITNCIIINEGERFAGGVVIEGEQIQSVFKSKPDFPLEGEIIDAGGKWLIPGVIDDHVHFREPGATQKADIASESAAAVAGGVTSFMDMPNNTPPTVNLSLLEEKYARAAEVSLANYSFYLGADNSNTNEIKKIDPRYVCGVKLFMGSSTGNMLVDEPKILSAIFAESPVIIAVHCEEGSIIRRNLEQFKQEYDDTISAKFHPLIRSEEACIRSTAKAIELALRYRSRLHVLHLTTAKEIANFPTETYIFGEICAHHLWFSDDDYTVLGNLIKCNPAIKTVDDREALRRAVHSGKISVVGSDHAPHLWDEKQLPYLQAPSGIPLVQHSLQVMLELCRHHVFTPEQVVERMCHGPAKAFGIQQRGFIREGYYADLVLIEPDANITIDKTNILYKCGWSPFEDNSFHSRVTHTFVNGHLVWNDGQIDAGKKGQRLIFKRSL